MRYFTLINIKCPYDKNKLELYHFEETKISPPDVEINCYNECFFEEKKDCEKCLNINIFSGILYCKQCKRWYPIKDSIAFLWTDDLRSIEIVSEFRSRYKDFFKKMEIAKNLKKDITGVKKVRDFWNQHVCMGVWEDLKTQFEELEKWRYKRHYWIPDFLGFDKISGFRIMEAGCSQGIDLLNFCRRRNFVVGIDLSYEGLKMASKRIHYYNQQHNADLIIANCENLPFSEEVFDYTYSYGAIHHSPNTELALSELFRVLKKDGICKWMAYYKLSITNFIETSAFYINRILVFITKDADILYKALKKFPTSNNPDSLKSYKKTGKSAVLNAPYTNTFTIRRAKKLFSSARDVSVFLKDIHPIISFFTRRISFLHNLLERYFGFILMVSGIKK